MPRSQRPWRFVTLNIATRPKDFGEWLGLSQPWPSSAWLDRSLWPERSIASQITFAVIAVGATMVLQIALLGSIEQHVAFFIFLPALTLAALFGRLPAGLLAALLSVLLVSLSIAPFRNAPNWAAAIQFLSVATVIIFMAEVLHRVHGQAFAAALESAECQGAATALAEREAWLKAVLDGAADGIITIDGQGIVKSINPAATAIFGYGLEEVIGRSVNMLMPEHCHEAHDRYLGNSVKTGQTKAPGRLREVEGRRKDGSVFPMECGVSDVYYRGKHLFVGVVRDITGRKKAEEQIKLLMHEVNHRSKNLLMVVMAVTRQMASGEEAKIFADRLGERLAALAGSYDALVRDGWRGVEVSDLVKSQLAHFKDLIGKRVFLEGPPAQLNPAAAQSLGMALHELATNAGKYGALSTVEGEVRVAWKITSNGAKPRFEIRWSEKDGPPCQPPQRRGFGHTVLVKLAEQALGADVVLDFRPSGLLWQMSAEASGVIEGAAAHLRVG
ncbi:MAG: PAS domain S-box protein [Rhodomicrobium sp.]